MMFDVMALMMVGLTISFISRIESAPCASGTVALDVASTADAMNLTAALACTGEAAFDITWSASLTIGQRIKVSNRKNMTVNGIGFPSIRGAQADSNGASADDDGGTGTGIFSVSNGSTLHLNDLVLEGGGAEYGGAVDLLSSSSLFVSGCTFANNNASNGGAISSSNSSIYITGNTSFNGNSAHTGGAMHLHDNSVLQIEGSTDFLNNSATVDDGGALFVSTNCSIDVDGDIVFDSNSAGGDGGALYLYDRSSMRISGSVFFANNVAQLFGGAISGKLDSAINTNGNTSFVNNIAGQLGGAVSTYYRCSFQFDGSSSFVNNLSMLYGGVFSALYNASVNVNGIASFVSNEARDLGGVVYANENSVVVVDGDSTFDNNIAGNSGGASSVYGGSTFQTSGRVSFANNYAGSQGGAMLAAGGYLLVGGDNYFYNNSAKSAGGALAIFTDSFLTMDGNTIIDENSAGTIGGAIYASESSIRIEGNTSVTHNSASSVGGGVIYGSKLDISIDGCTNISHNSGYDGGAIYIESSDLRITGNTTFAYNSASRAGGAIRISSSNLTIGTNTHGSEVSSVGALTTGTASFFGNTAVDIGGAVSLENPVNFNFSDVTFTSNEAESGGAVSLKTTTWATSEFQRCRFERNEATRGGALYFNGKGQRFLHDSSFRVNVAEETGGAVYNAGALEIDNTVFAENMATTGGLAIHNVESAVVLSNVTFAGNLLDCPSETYSYTEDASSDTCRFELACAQCLDGCESDLSNVTIDSNTLPACKSIPEGVEPSSTAITLQTFDIKQGYYRISTDSRIVLKCYQADACVGGINPSDYCAVGYTGPYCAVCMQNYAPGPSSRCYKCSGENKGLLVGFSTAVVFLALLMTGLTVYYLLQMVGDSTDEAQNQPRSWWRGKVSRFRNILVQAIPLSSIRIVLVVVQIVVQFTDIAGAVYPEEHEAFLSTMALANFDFGSILSSSCLFDTNFYDKLIIATVAPVVISVACAVTFFIAKTRNQNSHTARAIVKRKHLSVVLFMVFFVYSSVSFTIFQTFVCDSLGDGNAYLRADYSITCNTERHSAYVIYASLMVCVYPVGIPAFFAFWLVRHRRDLDKPDRETMSNLRAYRCIWVAYKPSCYYYEVVECGRRIVLTGAAVFVLPGTAEQVAIVLLFAVVFMFVSESLTPFNSASDMWLYRWGNGIILASMYVALLLKVDLAREGSRGSLGISTLLIAAHGFMFFTVVMQTFLMMRGLCISNVQAETGPSRRWRSERASCGSELEA